MCQLWLNQNWTIFDNSGSKKIYMFSSTQTKIFQYEPFFHYGIETEFYPIFLLIFLFLFSIFYWPMIYSLNLYFLIDYDIWCISDAWCCFKMKPYLCMIKKRIITSSAEYDPISAFIFCKACICLISSRKSETKPLIYILKTG